MAATLTYSENGLRISGRIIAGDSASFRIAEGIDIPDGARLRWTLTDARPPDATHTIAASDEIDPTISLDSKMSLRTPEIRQAFRGCRITETIPAVLELIDTVHDAVYCSIRVQVANSRAVWLESDDFGNLSGLSAEDVRRELVGHTSRMDNPHSVSAGQVGADPAGTAAKAVGAHNTSETAHADIRVAVSTAQSAVGSAIDAAKAVAGAINAHAASTENPHGVTEEQVAAATEDTDKLFGRLNEPNTWKKHQYVVGGLRVDTTNGEATSEVMSVAKTEYGNVVKFSNCNVSAEGCLIDADAFVTKSILLIDRENGNFYEVSAIGGKLAFNNEPVTLDQVRSATTSAQE